MVERQRPAALITGGARRIGKAIVLELAQKGYDIALHYNYSLNEAQNLQKEVRSLRVECELFQTNFDNPKETTKLIDRVVEIFPNLEILINNASIYESGSFLEDDLDHLERQFLINFKTPYILTRDFAIRQKKGHVINIADTKINQLAVEYFGYTLSKKTLYDFTRMAAKELAPHIRVNGICPGPILPPKSSESDYMDKRSESVPLKKTGNPELISGTVWFLIENTFITGECIHVDGGEHLTN
jgi:NAD(P)-dependent dehydrogenase (short-subunit alcohol dehydrogenase family)